MASDRKAKLAEVNHWDELLALRDRQREQTRNGIQVIKEAELPLEVSRHGLMRWYLHPAIKDTCLSVLLFFQQEIPPGSRSGRLKFQGGQILFIVEGRGLFHVHPSGGPVFAIEVQAGDLISVPRGTHHWFDLCADRRIRAIRLFQDASGWTPHYTKSGVDANFQPVCFGPAFVPRGGSQPSA